MQTIETLNAQISEYQRKLNASNFKEILPKVKELEEKIKEQRIIERLKQVNAEQTRLRDAAKLAYEAEQPETDITTNNGTFHATKVKKFPNLAKIQYCTGKFEDGKLTELRINGIKFYMFKTEYKYGEPTKYTRPETFSEFLKLNCITEQDMELNDFKRLIEETEKINAEYKEAVKKFDSQKTALNLSFFGHIGLLKQQNAGHTYEYNANLY